MINLGAAIITYFAVAAVLAIPGVWSAEHTMKGLVAAVIPGRRTGDHTLRELFGGLADNTLELTTLVTGALVALALASPLWPLATGGALVMVWVHKGVLDKQLDLLGELDHTTGLYNMKGFYKITAEVLDTAQHGHGSEVGWVESAGGWLRQVGDLCGVVRCWRPGARTGLLSQLRRTDCLAALAESVHNHAVRWLVGRRVAGWHHRQPAHGPGVLRHCPAGLRVAGRSGGVGPVVEPVRAGTSGTTGGAVTGRPVYRSGSTAVLMRRVTCAELPVGRSDR